MSWHVGRGAVWGTVLLLLGLGTFDLQTTVDDMGQMQGTLDAPRAYGGPCDWEGQLEDGTASGTWTCSDTCAGTWSGASV